MCGIAGIVGNSPLDPSYGSILGAMLSALRHRGPDDEGRHVDGCAMLGQRRLSVIDLETGRQPISNEDGTVVAVVNGEFYNHVELRDRLMDAGHSFRTMTDSECIVHLYEDYGDQCFEHVNGMFAAAVWDPRRRRLLLARDRLGVKPLYFAIHGDVMAFASELKALLLLPFVTRAVDPTSLMDYLTFDFIPSPHTIFKGVGKLAPGTRLVFESGRARVDTYWDLHTGDQISLSFEDASAELWNELRKATRSRLVADVPVGSLLSGGVDSAAVASAMARITRGPIVTVTSGFRERGFDERQVARHTSRRIGSIHHEHLVSPEAADLPDTLVGHFDEPFADPSAIAMYLLSMHARRHVTVALSGDGGDEVLAGYRRYRFDCAEESVRRWMPAGIRRTVFGKLAAIYPKGAWLPAPLRAGATLRDLVVDGATAHGLSIAGMQPTDAVALLDVDLARQAGDYDPLDHVRRLYDRCDATDHLSKCQYVDIRLGLADGILTKVDRASMAHALEVRSPMLDYRFIEWAFRTPPGMRIRKGRGKALLRHALSRELGEEAAARPKSGFNVPLDLWTRGPLKSRIEAELLSPDARLNEWIAPGAIRRIWNQHRSGHSQHGATIWKLLMLQAWARRYSGSSLQFESGVRNPVVHRSATEHTTPIG